MKTPRVVAVAVLMVASASALHVLRAEQTVNMPAMKIDRSGQI
jgi:hypothetical protein